jgi:hypothetical protein
MLKCPFDWLDEMVDDDVDTVTVNRTLFKFKFCCSLFAVAAAVAVVVVVAVCCVMSDICEFDFVSGLSKSENVLATDLRSLDCRSDGASVPFRVSLH